MKILFALPGLHRVNRGAEVAFIEIARALARSGDEVTLAGSGPRRPDEPYHYIQCPAVPRERFERFPTGPLFRGDTAWEDASFAFGLLRRYRPADFDVTLTCAYPFTNFVLRRPSIGKPRPPHVFVTQNGDWPAFADNAEFRMFDCDGLVCINPDYQDRNRARYRTALIPNGVDLTRFHPGPSERSRLGLPENVPIVLMVSALIASKNVGEAVIATGRIPDAHLVVAGDGHLRDEIVALAEQHIPGRYHRISVQAEDMPALYRSADLFLHLSRDESFGNVYVEALASGIPIVAYDLPRTRWILAEQANYCEQASASVAERIAAVLAAPSTARVQSERAMQFGWDTIAGQYRSFLTEVVQSSLSLGKPSIERRETLRA